MEETTILQGRAAVATLDEESRAKFIARTYAHLLGAVILFTLIDAGLFTSGIAYDIAVALLGTNWLLVLGGFVLLGWLARRAAHTAESKPLQYAALAGYVIAESIIFVPLLAVIQYEAGGGVIESAAVLTLVGFTGLTAVVFTTRKDFSFLAGVLRWGGVVALMLIVGGVFFGLQLGTFFSVGMIALAGCAVLYDTSKIVHHHPEDRYVGAALELFASIALMFWYILRLLSRR
jgi:FtsH-binding integral membrane protein